jgi:hypothetical protein
MRTRREMGRATLCISMGMSARCQRITIGSSERGRIAASVGQGESR